MSRENFFQCSCNCLCFLIFHRNRFRKLGVIINSNGNVLFALPSLKTRKLTSKVERTKKLLAFERMIVTVIVDENQKTKLAGNKSRKSVIVIGDSLLNGIDDRGLCKHHHVKVPLHPGATTRDIADHVKPVARRKPDVVIIHCGTNDLTNNVDTTKHLKEVVQILKEESPHSKIVMSAAIMRRDRQGMKEKSTNLTVKSKRFVWSRG